MYNKIMLTKNIYKTSLILLFVMSSCGNVGASSPSESVSNSESSSLPVRRSVDEMISQLNEKSYTLDVIMDGFGILNFAVDQPLYQVTYTFDESGFVEEYFVDLTNDFTPVIYQAFEGGLWRTSIGDTYTLTMGLLSPLMFVDPTLIEDSWFDWDSETDLYTLNSQYLGSLFQNSPLLGVEDLIVSMNADNEIIISIGGRMDDVVAGNIWYTLVYSDIGSTRVSLPTNVTSIADEVFNELSTNQTNHYFYFYVTPVGGMTEIIAFGSRMDDTFLLSSMNSLQGNVNAGFEQAYFTKEGGQFIQILNSSVGYSYSIVSETDYNLAVENFYPISIFDITEAWIDLDSNIGSSGYPIRSEFNDRLLNIDFGQDASNIAASIFFEESHWSGLSVTVNISFNLGLVAYEATFRLHGTNQVMSIHPPVNRGQMLSLEAILALAQQTESYYLEQKAVDTNGIVISFDYASYRDQDNYLLFGVNSQGFWRYDFYVKEEETFVKYIYNYNSSSFVRTVIDEATYLAEAIEASWLRFEDFSLEFIESETSPTTRSLKSDSWLSFLSDSILDLYTITSGTIEIIDASELSPAFRFKFETTTLQNGGPLTLSIDLSYIGGITVEPPTVSEVETVEPIVNLMLNDYVTMFSGGLTSYFGVLFSYDTLGTLSRYQEFSVNETLFLSVDFILGKYLTLSTDNDQLIEEQGDFSLENMTKTTLNDLTFNERVSGLTYVQFDTITIDDFDIPTSVEGEFYQIREESLTSIFNLPLNNNEVMTQASLKISNSGILFQINVVNTVTDELTTYFIYFDSFNLPLNIQAQIDEIK